MDDDEETTKSLPAMRFHAIDVPLLVFGAIGDFARAVVNICDNVTQVLAMHSNYQSHQEEWQSQTLREIEALPSAEEEDQ